MSYDSHCCIVGGGPAGMILALLFGRAGIPTTILEQHEDFERDFRGDTVHPSTMELMDALGLAERLLRLPHAKIHRLSFDGPGGPIVLADLTRLPTKFPYITMMPQARFLEFLAAELTTLPSVRLVMGATAHGLLWEDPRGFSGMADRGPDTAPREAVSGGPISAGRPSGTGGAGEPTSRPPARASGAAVAHPTATRPAPARSRRMRPSRASTTAPGTASTTCGRR
jgi:hypothetical protein